MSLPHNKKNRWLKFFFVGFLLLANYVFWQNFLNSAQAVAQQTSIPDVLVAETVQNENKKFEQKTKGLLMFRGTPYRNFYGTGPLNTIAPEMVWKYPNENSKINKPLCARSFVGNTSKIWCGSGWTGQPVVWERPDGITEIITNTYDKGIHFINASNGIQTRAPFYTGDIIKGTVTMDPDNYPLLYSGSRDNFYRIIALDRDVPTELWKIEAKKSDGVWNDDWDPNGIILNDILYTGSENGWFHAIKLNRGYDAQGKVTVAPIEIFKYPTYADGYIDKVGDEDLSVESSPLLIGNTIYIANSGGRILGFDISNINTGIAPVVFDFWTGDDTDATLVADSDGYIYSVSEYERMNEREKIGQILKLDPRKYKPEYLQMTQSGELFDDSDIIVWGINVPKKRGVTGGAWATPAIHDNRLYIPTNPGDLLLIDTKIGSILDSVYIGTNAWSSPALIDNNLIVGTCEGKILNFDISKDTLEKIWEHKINSGSCIESSPAVWNGQIFFGARDGYIYSIK